MADLKISQLTGATTPLAGTEVVPLVQSSTTKKVSVANLTAGRTVQMSSLDANGGSSTGGAIISGTIPAVRASSTVLDVGDGNRYLALGANASTPGVIKLIAASSDASIYEYVLTSDTSYNVTFNKGNLVQGTAGKGVNFTANTPAAGMTSQLLNWYEEGTWTPSVSDGTTSVAGGTASYIRIGKQVICSIAFYGKNISGLAASGLRISGLPFANNGTYGQESVIYATTGANTAVGAFVSGSNTHALLYFGSSGPNASALTKSSFLDATQASLWGTIIYRAA